MVPWSLRCISTPDKVAGFVQKVRIRPELKHDEGGAAWAL